MDGASTIATKRVDRERQTMRNGEIKRADLIRALETLGGREHHQGGESILHFHGTTVTIGRRNFSRAMLCRLLRKLRHAGITEDDFWRAIEH